MNMRMRWERPQELTRQNSGKLEQVYELTQLHILPFHRPAILGNERLDESREPFQCVDPTLRALVVPTLRKNNSCEIVPLTTDLGARWSAAFSDQPTHHGSSRLELVESAFGRQPLAL